MTGAASIEGHCLCGAVTITLDNPVQQVEICQCGMCRRWGGAFYSAQSGDNPQVTGANEITEFRSSEWAERAFCSKCGSNLWFRFLPTEGDHPRRTGEEVIAEAKAAGFSFD